MANEYSAPEADRTLFRIGEAFPHTDPVAVAGVTVAAALNDLVTTAKWLVDHTDNSSDPGATGQGERLYLLRLGVAHLYETREAIKHAQKESAVSAFLDALPDEIKADLDQVMNPNTSETPWLSQAIKHIRNQTSHYGGRYNWEDVEWALEKAADIESGISNGGTVAGTRLHFADEVSVQHLTRKYPEHTEDPTVELDDTVIQDRLATMFQSLAEARGAAQRLLIGLITSYLSSLPAAFVRSDNRGAN